MQKNTIHRSKTGLFTELSNVLTYNQERFSTLLANPFSKEAFQAQIETKSAYFTQEKRTILKKEVISQYRDMPLDPKVAQHIELLTSEHTFTLTTGHQLNLFTGPIYFIYKIIHVIRLAEELQKIHPTKHFVPVFWMASEDHDFEEINHTRMFGKEIRWDQPQGGPVGEYELENWEEMRETVRTFFQNNPESEVNHLLESYTGKNLAQATKSLVNSIFGEHGLLILEPNSVALKHVFSPIMQQEVTKSFAEEAVLKNNSIIEAAGFKTQVFPREINLFYIQKGIRERLILTHDQIEIPSVGKFSKAEICSQINEHPENFSPNVVLRPVYQECILPNLAYIGGGGEMAYWLQLKGVFDACKVPFPLIQVRNSVQLIDANTQKKLVKLGLNFDALFEPIHALKKQIILENSGETLQFEALDNATQSLTSQIQQQIVEVDPALAAYAAAEEVKILKQVEAIKAKLMKQQKAKFEGTMKQLEDIHEKMFPQQGVQERKENFLSFCAQGDVSSFINQLKSAIDPWEKDLIVLNLD